MEESHREILALSKMDILEIRAEQSKLHSLEGLGSCGVCGQLSYLREASLHSVHITEAQSSPPSVNPFLKQQGLGLLGLESDCFLTTFCILVPIVPIALIKPISIYLLVH